MFDFVNYTYSGVLAILATLFGLAYPLTIGCIERIDLKFNSTKLAQRFKNENSFKRFRALLVVNLIVALLFPFLMDGCAYGRIFIGLQCSLAIALVTYALILYSKIIEYYAADTLQKEILSDYHRARDIDKKQEEEFFTQWVDLTPTLLSSADEGLAKGIYQELANYITKKYDEKNFTYDLYFYEGISRINETLCIGQRKPVSVNNTNSILTLLLFADSEVSANSYNYLWRNLRVQLFYNRDEWIMEYWKSASQKLWLWMQPVSTSCFNEKTGNYYTEEEVRLRDKQREVFLEFHIMLCAMLVQQNKYDLLGLMLSYTQSSPPSYPLVPSNIGEVLDVFGKMNRNVYEASFYYEKKYQMPNMHGITGGKVVGAANYYLALLTYRVYVIAWYYNYRQILEPRTLPNTLAELKNLRESLNVFQEMLVQVADNKELLKKIISLENLDAEIDQKSKQFNGAYIRTPNQIVSSLISDIDSKMKRLREEQPLSIDKVTSVMDELREHLERVIRPYEDLLNSRFEQVTATTYNLDSSVMSPFENTAFVEAPDISHIGIADSMSLYMSQTFSHFLASAFYLEHPNVDYKISFDSLLDAIDRLNLNEVHYIISFGINWAYFVDRKDGLTMIGEHTYMYRGVKVLSLNCPTEFFSEMVYVMNYDDRPFMTFEKPSEEMVDRYNLEVQHGEYNLWASVIKIKDNPNIIDEESKTKLGNDKNKYSLFSAIWMPMLSFKPKDSYKMISIKVKYRPIDEGEYDTLDKIKPF